MRPWGLRTSGGWAVNLVSHVTLHQNYDNIQLHVALELSEDFLITKDSNCGYSNIVITRDDVWTGQ